MSNPSGSNTYQSSDVTPFPNSHAKWTDDEASRRGFVQHGVEDTPGKKAYFIHMEAKPGKEEQVQAFLRDILAGVEQEPLTGPWFGLRYSQTTFAIFEAFPHAQGRHDHDGGPGGLNFFNRADLLKEILAFPAQLYRMDIDYGKFGVLLGQKVQPVV